MSTTSAASVQTAVVGPSGQSLMVVLQDPSGSPSNVRTIALPTISASGGGGTGFGAYPLVGIASMVPGLNDAYQLAIVGSSGTFTLSTPYETSGPIDASQPPATVATAVASALGYLYNVAATDFTVTSSVAGQVTTFAIEYAGNSMCWRSWGDLSCDGSGLIVPIYTLIDNGQPGFTTTGPWNFWPAGVDNSQLYINSPVASTATWSFSGLSPGQSYQIGVAWISQSNRNPNAVYSLYNGDQTTAAFTIGVDQRNAPSGFEYNYWNYLILGSFVASGTTARLVLDASQAPSDSSLGDRATIADSCLLMGHQVNSATLTRVRAGTMPTYLPAPGQVTGAIVYQGGSNYTAAPALTVTGGLGSGASLTASVASGAVATISVAAGGSGYELGSFTVNGVSHLLPAPVYWPGGPSGSPLRSVASCSPSLCFPLPMTIAPTDVVTLSLKNGAIVAEAGPVAAVTAMPVANTGATSLLPSTVPTPTSLRVGYNVAAPLPLSPVPQFANWVKSAYGVSAVDAGTLVLGPNGYPTTGTTVTQVVANVAGTWLNGIDSRDLAGMPTSGVWTLAWDGPGQCALMPDPSMSLSLLTDSSGHAVGNRRTYQVDVKTALFNSANLSIRFDAQGVTNVQLYQPGIDASNPPLFNPHFLAQLAGAQSLRFMDACNANNNVAVDYSDYNDPNDFCYTSGFSYGGPVQSIGPVPAELVDGYYNHGVPILVTFAKPHGIRPWQTCYFSTGGGGGPHGNDTFDTVDGGVVQPASLMARVLSPTTVAFAVPYGDNTTLAKTYTGAEIGPNPSCGYGVATGWPIAHVIALCNQVGADLWFNVPACISDACVTALATQFAQGLNPGLKCRLEYTNEHWNYGFIQAGWCIAMGATYQVIAELHMTNFGSGYSNATTVSFSGGGGTGAAGVPVLVAGQITGILMTNPGSGYTSPPTITFNDVSGHGAAATAVAGLSGDGFYMLRAGQVHTLARAAFVAAGRPATDLIRVAGSQWAYPYITYSMCGRAQNLGVAFDELAIAPYYENAPAFQNSEPSLDPVCDQLNYQQMMDVAEHNMLYGGYASSIPQHASYLQQTGYSNVQLVCYEGGTENGLPYALTHPQAALSRYATQRSLAWALDPRQYGIIMCFLKQLQDTGVTLFNHYTSSGINSLSGGTNWVCFRSWNQLLGRGDGSDGKFDNRTNYDDQQNIVCVVGQAYRDWNTAISGRSSRSAMKLAPRVTGPPSNSVPFGTRSRSSR